MRDNDKNIEVDKDLLQIKNEIRRPAKKKLHQNEIGQITSQLKDLSEKVDDIKQNLSQGNSNTKLKKKKEIIYLLKKEGKITTSDLSDKIDLSRTRCSEYLNEMKKEGIVKDKKEGRTKYYSLDL